MATQKAESLFEHSESVCKECRRNLPPDYPGEVCPACKERILFSQVKDFIRENDVTEFDVSKHFDIPLFKVKGWIREGRIEYKDLDKCLRKSNITGSAAFSSGSDEEEKFRFLQK